MSRGRVVIGGIALIAAVALSAPAAFAADGSVTGQGYPCATAPPPAPGGTSGSEQCGTAGVAGVSKTITKTAKPAAGAPAAAAVAPAKISSGTLPFTGAQLEIFLIVGLALIGGGLVLRRSGRDRTNI